MKSAVASDTSVTRSSETIVVRLEGITKRYGSLLALNDVTFTIGRGITGLLGPNGAGKTTLIKVIMGLVRVSAGEGTVLGHRLPPEARRIRHFIGYMPEDDCYIAGLTGVEMVQFAARLSGMLPIEALRRAHEILDFSGVEQERYRAVDAYSTGMRQKLKFAQAIVHDPPLMILDEPTAGLDPEERLAMLHRIRVLVTEFGKSVLLSTHILPDVREVCEQVVIVARGKVQVTDSLESLSRPTSPTFHLRTLGDPAALIRHLEAMRYAVRTTAEGIVQVQMEHSGAEQVLWKAARETGVGIRSLVPARNSLEQVFMDAVRGGEHADS